MHHFESVCMRKRHLQKQEVHHITSHVHVIPTTYHDIRILLRCIPIGFEGLEDFQGNHIILDKEIRPVINATRLVPINLHN